MINLLPTDYADSIRYGRQNNKLRLWLIGMAVAIVGLVVVIAGGWVYINQQQKSLQANVDSTNQQLVAQNQAKVQKDAKEISGDIKVITKVLGTEIRFSDIIQAIGNDMPPGAVLSSLSLSNKINGALDLTSNTKDYPSAAQVAVNLSQSQNNLFSKVDIVSVSCSSDSPQAYKCTGVYRALFSKEATTKFLSVPKVNK